MKIHHSDTEQVAAMVQAARNNLRDMAPEVAWAVQLREFMPEKTKNLLACHMRQYIEADMPVAKAEILARTQYQYVEELNDLMKQLEAAELVIHQYKAEQAICGSYHNVVQPLVTTGLADRWSNCRQRSFRTKLRMLSASTSV